MRQPDPSANRQQERFMDRSCGDPPSYEQMEQPSGIVDAPWIRLEGERNRDRHSFAAVSATGLPG
jgi:hypothetical protein